MYLIQQTTKQSTNEILGFFYDFGKEIFIIGIDAMKDNQRSIRKQVEAIYPNTNIPFQILVNGSKYHGSISGYIEVNFPSNPSYINTEGLLSAITEQILLGSDAYLPDFEKPKSRTPKMYKDLIEQVLKDKGKQDG